jgi:hypothetical protein
VGGSVRTGRARLAEWVEDIRRGDNRDIPVEDWVDSIMGDINRGIITSETAFKDVTRITVVGARGGVLFERYNAFTGGAELHLQDEGRTLKIFERTGKVVE